MNQTLLLTGASGFVGSGLLRHYCARGRQVVAIARNRPADVPRNVTWIDADMLSLTAAEVAALVDGYGITHALHTAWYTNHADYLDSPQNELWRDAGIVFADGFFRGGGRRLVVTGTCLEYETETAHGPLSEDAPLAPILRYSLAKAELAAEIKDIAARSGGAAAWARVFFVYGPGDRAGRFVPHVLGEVGSGRSVRPRYGGVVRDYIHVDDLAAQLAAVTEGELVGAVNVGSGEAVTMSQLCRYAAAAAGRPLLAEPNDVVGDRLGDWIAPDLARLRREIGPPAARPLQDGLRELLVS